MTSVLLIALLAWQDQTKVLPRPPATPQPPSAYEQVVMQYVKGDCENAVAEIAGHSAQSFALPFDLALAKIAYRAQDEKLLHVQRMGAGIKRTPTEWFQAHDDLVRFLLGAMMLHTEASLRTPVDEMHAQLAIARTAEKALSNAEQELEPHVWNKVKFEMPKGQGSGYLTKTDVDHARHDR